MLIVAWTTGRCFNGKWDEESLVDHFEIHESEGEANEHTRELSTQDDVWSWNKARILDSSEGYEVDE